MNSQTGELYQLWSLDCYRGFNIGMTDWIIGQRWLISIFSPSHLLRSQEVRGVWLKSSNPLITVLVLLAISPHPQLPSRSCSLAYRRPHYGSHHLRDSNSFRSSVPEMGQSPIYISIINDNIMGTLDIEVSACDQSEHGILGPSVRYSLCTFKSCPSF